MALINCPECGTEVSEKADNCPKCAYPINKIETNSPKVTESSEGCFLQTLNFGCQATIILIIFFIVFIFLVWIFV